MKPKTFTYNNKQYTSDEIKEKLKWFHGNEFKKYPFVERPDD